MAHQEVPIQGGVRACLFAFAHGGVVAAGATRAAHSLDVFAGCNIRLAGHQTPVAILAHPQGVGQLDPFNRIHINGQEPLMHLAWMHAQQQCVQANHHQSLNVVGIALCQRLGDRLFEASHVCLAAPKPLGQVVLGLQCVVFNVVGHLGPINAPHIFAPTQNLPDKTLGTLQWHMATAVSRFNRLDHFMGTEQLQVQCGREVGVIEPWFAWPECILIAPKQRQTFLYKTLQCVQGLIAGDGPCKAVQAARVMGKSLLNQAHHLACDGVGCKAGAWRQSARPMATKCLTVVGIKVPLTPRRLTVVHQDAKALAQFAVEELQPQ